MEDNKIQVRLGQADLQRLERLSSDLKVPSSAIVRAGLTLALEAGLEDAERLRRLLSEEWSFPHWWKPLCRHLQSMKATGEPLVTPKLQVPNEIVTVDELGGSVGLRSLRGHRGQSRTITVAMLQNRKATAHGVILEILRDLAEEADDEDTPGWVGPFVIDDLLHNCIADDQSWPPEHGGAYLVSQKAWTNFPTADCSPLYVGGITGRSPRFRTRVGDLLADMFGFFGETTGHSSGGQSLNQWSRETRTPPHCLFLGWYLPASDEDCNRCIEKKWHDKLTPRFNKNRPPDCEHASRTGIEGEEIGNMSHPKWHELCCRLLGMKASGQPVTTLSQAVRNEIIEVDEAGGRIVLRSPLSKTNKLRTITDRMVSKPNGTTHGRIVAALRRLVDWTG